MKPAIDPTGLSEYFHGHAAPLEWSAGAVPQLRRRILTVAALLSLPLMILATVAPGWLSSSIQPASQVLGGAQPLSGTWGCSLAGAPVGNLTIDGWNYVLGSAEAGGRMAGALELVVFPTKYREEIIRVQGGTLGEEFGARLGFHYDVAGEPEMLVFNLGPGSGIRCTRP